MTVLRIPRVARLAIVLAINAAALELLLARVRRTPELPIWTRVEINAPVERVWEVVSDIPRQPEWMREMKQVRVLSPGPVGAGTEAEATVRIFGIAVSDPVVVSAWDPPRAFGVSHDGLFRGGGHLTLTPGSGGATTIIRWREILVPPVLPFLGSLIQWPIFRWIFQDDLYRLRNLIEDS